MSNEVRIETPKRLKLTVSNSVHRMYQSGRSGAAFLGFLAIFAVIVVTDHFSFRDQFGLPQRINWYIGSDVWGIHFTFLLAVALICIVTTAICVSFDRSDKNERTNKRPKYSEKFGEAYFIFLTMAYLVAMPIMIVYLLMQSDEGWTTLFFDFILLVFTDVFILTITILSAIYFYNQNIKKYGK